MVAFPLLRASFALVTLLAPATLAAPAAPKTVLTPFGERLVDSVHAVPEGGRVVHVGKEIRLLDAAGKVVHGTENRGTNVRRTAVRKAVVPGEGSAYAYWINNGSEPISSFDVTWKVPPIPATTHNQIIFTSLEISPASRDPILRSVLQYGRSLTGGGSYWSVASWYITSEEIYYTSSVPVSVGDSLKGVITLTDATGGSYNYLTSFDNIAGTQLAALGVEQFTYVAEAVQAYNVNSTSDYPLDPTVFSPINVGTTTGFPNVTWVPVSNAGLVTTVDVQGAKDASVTITYPA